MLTLGLNCDHRLALPSTQHKQFGFSYDYLSSSVVGTELPIFHLKWFLGCTRAGMNNVDFVSVTNCTFEFIILVGFLLGFEKIPWLELVVE